MEEKKELSVEELDQVSGGGMWDDIMNPSEEQRNAIAAIIKTGICPKCKQQIFYALDKATAAYKHVKQCYKQ